MLMEWIVKENYVIYLIAMHREVDKEDDLKTDGGTVYKKC